MTNTLHGETHTQAEAAVALLRTTATIRERAGQLLARARAGESTWFTVEDGFIDTAAAEIRQATQSRYGRHTIPIHSRWRHFEAGGVDRKSELDRMIGNTPHATHGHTYIDLAVVSVLLDGGAGSDWTYTDASSGKTFSRSEGLAVASYHAFTSGLFSSDKTHPLQADSVGLRALVTDHLAAAFQVTPTNPLVGIEERAILLRRLGEVIAEQPEVFGEDGRPAGLLDMLISPLGPDTPHTAEVKAHDILSQVLASLSDIWPAANSIAGIPVGDCWRHSAVRGEGLSDGWIPFHKLSQWMTYSLLEPFEWTGVKVSGMNALTALPEYRNGGLLLDSGVLKLRDASAARETWQVGDEIIVEWRALTVALMDELAHRLEMPLARMLEGGSWAAGRELAQRHRNGLPPLGVASDGTVF